MRIVISKKLVTMVVLPATTIALLLSACLYVFFRTAGEPGATAGNPPAGTKPVIEVVDSRGGLQCATATVRAMPVAVEAQKKITKENETSATPAGSTAGSTNTAAAPPAGSSNSSATPVADSSPSPGATQEQ